MTRTYKMAHDIARRNPDRIAACKLLCNLLWHVDREQGGFIGLSDAELEAKCAADRCLSLAAATAAQWSPEPWPQAVSQQRAA